ncbi:MAG: hypothetical protein ACYDAL_05625 [Candidatus Dormibacteraceae bacterium]
MNRGDLRSVESRKADVLGVLEGQHDLWLATGDRSGRPHMIAVSGWWDGAGAPNDVVMIDAAVVESVAAKDAGEVADGRDVMRNSTWLA